MWTALLFEAQSIQSFIFATNRLRDAVGASELLDALTNETTRGNLLDAVLEATESGGGDRIAFSRRAGGSFYAFSRDGALLRRFADLWVTAVQRWAPGLDFSIALACGSSVKEAFDAARKKSRGRQPKAQLPMASPVTLRAPRTGAPAVRIDRKDESIDAATLRRKAFSNPALAGFVGRFSPDGVTWRQWPVDFDADDDVQTTAGNDDAEVATCSGFPFRSESRFVAFIHGDGNGMGQALRVLQQAPGDDAHFIELFRRFSHALQESSIEAAQQATREVLQSTLPDGKGASCLPARPLILGGDDLLIVVRADLALAYVQSFARAFEDASRNRMRDLSVPGLPEGMSMGFGVAYVSADQPFALAAAMAEELMDRAKKHAKRLAARPTHPDDGAVGASGGKASAALAPSTVQFHRITATIWSDPDGQIDAETSVFGADGKTSYRHTLGCYALDAAEARRFDLPALDDLFGLQSVLQSGGIAHGAMRGLLNTLELSESQARDAYKRWRQQMRQTKEKENALGRFDAAMIRLHKLMEPDTFPYVQDKGDPGISVSGLGDALTLRAIGSVPGPKNDGATGAEARS